MVPASVSILFLLESAELYPAPFKSSDIIEL